MRLQEHAELRSALGIERVPDYTTLYRCVRRTGEDELTRLLRTRRFADERRIDRSIAWRHRVIPS